MLIAPYPTKKALQASIGQPLRFRETSMFGSELQRPGSNVVAGPSDYHLWYAKVEIDADGIILAVDGKRVAGPAPSEPKPPSERTRLRKAKEAAVRRAFYGGRDPMANPKNPPADADPYADPHFPLIYPEVTRIEMKRGHGKYKGEPFYHTFNEKKNPAKRTECRGLKAGTVIELPDGRRIKLDQNAVLLRGPRSLFGSYRV